LAGVRQVAETPVALGFGISTPAQAHALADMADGIIVGSEVVRRAAAGADGLQAYVASLRAALARE